MDERAARLNHRTDARTAPRAAVQELGSEVAEVREDLDALLGELDRRRHEALDLPLQLRRHAFGASLTTVALVAAAAGSVWLAMWRRQRRQRLGARARRLREALYRMTESPERVATEPSVAVKIAVAAANAAVAMLVKRGLERGVRHLMEARAERARRPELSSP